MTERQREAKIQAQTELQNLTEDEKINRFAEMWAREDILVRGLAEMVFLLKDKAPHDQMASLINGIIQELGGTKVNFSNA